tara:strand:- start:35176 stop:37491 length:2316 start_codon:yes stop_codon:yes gene_type:complete
VKLDLNLVAAGPKDEFIGGKQQTFVYLFGRSLSGESYAVKTKPLLPYFFVISPSDEIISKISKHPEVNSVDSKILSVKGKDCNCLKVELHHPGKVPRVRDWIRDMDCDVLAADIPFHHRYLYDHDIGGSISIEGEPKSIDGWSCPVVDTNSVTDSDTFAPSLKILSFDIENSIETREIYCICYEIREDGKTVKEGKLSGKEDQIIKDFVKAISDYDPDLITGYNIDGYDLPLLEERAKHNQISLKLGRDGSEIRQLSQRRWRIFGRIIADAWWNVKREIRPRQETLNAVSKELLGREKQDVNPKDMDNEWQKNPDKVIEYCLEDARLALDIMEKIMVIPKYQHLGYVAKLPLDEVLNGMTSTLIDSLMIRSADSKSIGVPMTRREKRGDRHIAGGYVHAVKNPGIHNWVCVLDFKSMYPSIIIDRNLCFTTLSDKGEIETPHGVKFLSPEQKKGLLPELLKGLMSDRDQAKASMRNSKTDEEKEHFRRVQDAIKILMNSVYGVFASYFYRFTDLGIGASITAYARKYVQDMIEELEGEDLDVIYGDTDSVFFSSPHNNLSETVDFGISIADRYSEGARQLEFEKILNPFFTHGVKKRYVGKVVWPDESVLVRGYETRRTDAFPAQVNALKAVFSKILDGDEKGAIDEALTQVSKIKSRNVEVSDLVISKSVSDRVYKNPEGQAHLKAKNKWEEYTGTKFTPGMKIAYVVTNTASKTQEVEPFFAEGKPPKPDFNYYAKRVAKTLARLTDVWDYDEMALLSGKREPKQSTLF